ncbi:UDP-glycosyltransferase 78D2 [Senna tora]|uniref:UDP-glycosyltransferase 78D2 n=1 Tax=Senna tora TaxID=362788 RepID=A0A834SG31_9FABA|nr:UDP-glycosyltransferase 78D2 [Senna tora]
MIGTRIFVAYQVHVQMNGESKRIGNPESHPRHPKLLSHDRSRADEGIGNHTRHTLIEVDSLERVGAGEVVAVGDSVGDNVGKEVGWDEVIVGIIGGGEEEVFAFVGGEEGEAHVRGGACELDGYVEERSGVAAVGEGEHRHVSVGED